MMVLASPAHEILLKMSFMAVVIMKFVETFTIWIHPCKIDCSYADADAD